MRRGYWGAGLGAAPRGYLGAPWHSAQVLPQSLGPCCGCISPALSSARVIENLYRQHCLEKGKEQPPRLEAAVEDELLVMDSSTMWQKVKEGMEDSLVGGRCEAVLLALCMQ